MSNSDQIQRFLFDGTDIRGVLVGLEDSYRTVLGQHRYPVNVASLLGEMLAAVGLLSSTLKFDGRLSLMARGNGPVSLLMAECTHQRDLRALARWQEPLAEQEPLPEQDLLPALLGQGQLAITIEPDKGRRYQGVVPLDKAQLALCLEEYFQRSEQLATRICLAADGERAAGMLLQALPRKSHDEQAGEDWNRITQLGATLSSEELLTLENEAILHRLYHEETLRLFDADALQFGCDCSRERSLRALQTLPAAELEEMLKTDGEINMDCQFCGQAYRFDSTSVAELQGLSGAVAAPSTRH